MEWLIGSLVYISGPADFPWAYSISFGVTLASFGFNWSAIGLSLASCGSLGVHLWSLWVAVDSIWASWESLGAPYGPGRGHTGSELILGTLRTLKYCK